MAGNLIQSDFQSKITHFGVFAVISRSSYLSQLSFPSLLRGVAAKILEAYDCLGMIVGNGVLGWVRKGWGWSGPQAS